MDALLNLLGSSTPSKPRPDSAARLLLLCNEKEGSDI